MACTPPHAPVRHDQRAAGRDRRRDPQVGAAEPEGDDARPDHHRGRARHSRSIAWPFNLLDCCLVTDAGGAVVLTTAERARDCKQKPVCVLGVGEAHDHALISQMPDLTHVRGARPRAARAFEMAGVTHARHRPGDDLRLVHLHRAADRWKTSASARRARAARSSAASAPRRAAQFPLNTSGGGLSYTHPGMYGIFAHHRGRAPVAPRLRRPGHPPGPGRELAVVHGTGGVLSSAGTAILARA